jgi:DeoR family transcriptional regulator, suf operon transcriptional repressor
MQATRQDILDYLRQHAEATVRQLGTHLGLTSTGVRQHLTVLERDGLVESREERGHVGRPALVFRLTATGDGLYPKQYDELANALIEEARTLVGSDALQRLLKNVAARLAAPHLPQLDGRALPERVDAAASIMQERGNVAAARPAGDDYLIETHTCPFWNVATQNSAVCALDVEFVRLLVGADARLSSSLLRGDDGCTFRVRP